MRYLERGDIVGRKIVALLQTPWQILREVRVCNVFVQLDSGCMFELRGQNPFEEALIEVWDPSKMTLLQAEIGGSSTGCIGDTVDEVITSDYWPTFGLLLSSRRFLLCSDRGHSFLSVGAFLTPVDEAYGIDDVATYWGHRQVKPASHDIGS